MCRWPRETYAALSSMARTHSFRPDRAGRQGRSWMKPGEACTQCLASIRFEKRPITPWAPGGTPPRLPPSARRRLPPGRRPALLPLAEGVAEPAHRQAGVEADPLDHPLTRDRVAERAQPYLWVDQRPVQDDRVLPEGAADDGEAPRFGHADADQRRAACRPRRRRPAFLPSGPSRPPPYA